MDLPGHLTRRPRPRPALWVATGFAAGVVLVCAVWATSDLVLCAHGPVLVLPLSR